MDALRHQGVLSIVIPHSDGVIICVPIPCDHRGQALKQAVLDVTISVVGDGRVTVDYSGCVMTYEMSDPNFPASLDGWIKQTYSNYTKKMSIVL